MRRLCSYSFLSFFLTWGIEESRHLFIACIHSPVFSSYSRSNCTCHCSTMWSMGVTLCCVWFTYHRNYLFLLYRWKREREKGRFFSRSWAFHYCRIFGGVCGCADPPLGRPVRRRFEKQQEEKQEPEKNDVTFFPPVSRNDSEERNSLTADKVWCGYLIRRDPPSRQHHLSFFFFCFFF